MSVRVAIANPNVARNSYVGANCLYRSSPTADPASVDSELSDNESPILNKRGVPRGVSRGGMTSLFDQNYARTVTKPRRI